MAIGRHAPAPLVIERPLERLELFVEVELLAGLEHQHAQAARGERVRRHAAGGAGADHDRVVDGGEVDFLGARVYDADEHHGNVPTVAPAARQRRRYNDELTAMED